MDPWLAENVSENVREICEELVANETDWMHIEYQGIRDSEWYAIGEALKRNASLGTLGIEHGGFGGSRVLSLRAASSLALGIASHPSLHLLSFDNARFTEFSAIMMAIIQNSKLQKLEMCACCISPCVKQVLEILLTENALESLVLRDSRNQDEDPDAVDLPNVSCRNQSLKELEIHNNEGVALTARTLDGITRMLATNDRIERLRLDCDGLGGVASEAIASLVQGTIGHVSLRQIQISYCSGNGGRRLREVLGSLLTVPSALEELILDNCHIGNEGITTLAGGLSDMNCQLKKISLCAAGFDDSCFPLLSNALERSPSLEELNLCGNTIGDEGAIALASVISSNRNIRHLYLSRNNIGPEGAVAIARALSVNSTLRVLSLGANPIAVDGARALLNALEHNTSLQTSYFYGDRWFDGFTAKVNRFMKLNRGGRKILNSHDVPRSLWPYILAKSSKEPDVIYYFLQQKPELFKKQSLLGKRKRESSSCTIS